MFAKSFSSKNTNASGVGIMKVRTSLLVSCAASALLIGAGTLPAAAQGIPASAGWWFHGDAEIGGRVLGPDKGGPSTCVSNGYTQIGSGTFNFDCRGATRNSLGKFYEYRDLRPGPFGNLSFAIGSYDGLYELDFIARNIGYRDQSYWANLSQAGYQYLTVSFDQTPHIYNNNATTIFQNPGSAVLSVPAGLTQVLTGLPAPPATNAQQQTALDAINNNLTAFRLGFIRDTTEADYRWTPNSEWDVKVDWTGTARDGTQPMPSFTYTGGTGNANRTPLELPRPIKDRTDNGNVSAEYKGVTPWGKNFNVTLGYGISVYQNDTQSLQWQNPWVAVNAANSPLWNQIALAPSNSVQSFRANGGIELPWQSRYVFGVQYNMGRQNEDFLPFTINPLVNPAALGVGISANSLNGQTDTLLVNNQLTTQITRDLKTKFTFRHYDYINNTPNITVGPNVLQMGDANAVVAEEKLYRGLAYTKQNASGELVWTPSAWRWLTLGGGVYWERWDRDHADVNVTDEWTGKVFADMRLWDWGKFRSSYFHAERTGGNAYQCVEVESNCTSAANSTLRLFEMVDRSRDKGNFYLDIYLPNNITVTPTGGFRADDYAINPFANVAVNSVGVLRPELGMMADRAWNGGIEIAWSPSADFSIFGSYLHEEIWRRAMSGSNTAQLEIRTADRVETLLLGVKWAAVPKTLDLMASASYSFARGTFDQAPGGMSPTTAVIGNSPNIPPFNNGNTAFPDQTIEFIRFDFQGKYTFDPSWVRQMGFQGDMYAKIRAIWEHNEVSDWATVNQSYLALIANGDPYRRGIFMGWNNPNYNVAVFMASLGFKW